MSPNHADIDPYTPETGYFDCLQCGARETSTNRLHRCGSCDGPMHNIAVARE